MSGRAGAACPDHLDALVGAVAGDLEAATTLIRPYFDATDHVAGAIEDARHGIHVYVMPDRQGPGLLAGIDVPPCLVVHDAPAPALPGTGHGREAVAPSATMSRPVTGV